MKVKYRLIKVKEGALDRKFCKKWPVPSIWVVSLDITARSGKAR